MNRDVLQGRANELRARLPKEPLERRPDLLVELADVYLELRFYKAAAMVAKGALRLRPLHMAALLRLGRSLLGLDQADAARRLYEAVTHQVPELAEARWGLWAARTRLGLRRSAAEALEDLLARAPGDERARRQAADDRAAAGDPLGAARHLEALYRGAKPPRRELAVRLGTLLAEAGERSRALEYLEAALREGTTEHEVILQAAKLAAGLKDWRRTADLAARRLEAGPASLAALELLGRARLELEEHDAAILALEQLVERIPDGLPGRRLLAEAYFRAGELTSAERELQRCLARDPAQADALLRLAEIARRRNERQRAEELYERCLALDPGAALALFRLGVIKFERHLYAAAITCFKRLLVAQPNHYQGHLHLGRSLRVTGSFDRARHHLGQARELAVELAEPELELGLLDLELHRGAAAREHLERALVLDPSGEVGKRAGYELKHLQAEEVELKVALAAGGGAVPVAPPKGAPARWLRLC